MGQPILNKILTRASGGRSISAGDIVVVEAHTVVLYDSNFFPVYWRDPREIEDPSRICVIFDHRVPAPNALCAGAYRRAQVRQEVRHRARARRRLRPGHQPSSSSPTWATACREPSSCAATRTRAAAARFNCLARGVGGPDVFYSAIKGETWFAAATRCATSSPVRLGRRHDARTRSCRSRQSTASTPDERRIRRAGAEVARHRCAAHDRHDGPSCPPNSRRSSRTMMLLD